MVAACLAPDHPQGLLIMDMIADKLFAQSLIMAFWMVVVGGYALYLIFFGDE